MAIRYREDRKNWQVYWKNPYTGKQQSLTCATREEAEKTDDQIKYRLKWEKESFIPQEPKTEDVPHAEDCFESVYAAYLQEKRFARKNLAIYLKRMRPVLEEFGLERIGNIDRKRIACFIAKRQAAGQKTSSLNGLCVLFFAVLRWAWRRGYFDHMPALPELPRHEAGHYIPPTNDELARLLQVSPPHLQRIIIIGAKTGCRIGSSELYKMRWSDIDLISGVIHLRAAAKNKTEPVRDVPIKKSLLDLFRRWAEEDGKAGMPYVIHYDGKPLVSGAHGAWYRACREAGITRHIRLYDLRHAFATEAIAAGVDVGTVAKLMGHARVSMTLEHYQHVLTKQKTAAVEALGDVSEYVHGSMSKTIKAEIIQ